MLYPILAQLDLTAPLERYDEPRLARTSKEVHDDTAVRPKATTERYPRGTVP